MARPIAHFKTITRHRHLVARHCFRCGLYRQGLTHDLSKYSPVEFFAGAKYYQGTRSPNNAQREAEGCSRAWLHHKGRNKHHYEYWYDFDPSTGMPATGVGMPLRYVAEMVCDRIAACKVYNGAGYTDADPWRFFDRSRERTMLCGRTAALLEHYLLLLRDEGEDALFAALRRDLKTARKEGKYR